MVEDDHMAAKSSFADSCSSSDGTGSAAKDLLHTCVVCQRALREPVLLSCLHSCCRSCCRQVEQPAAGADGSSVGTTCTTCRRSPAIARLAASAPSASSSQRLQWLENFFLAASPGSSSASAVAPLCPELAECDVCKDIVAAGLAIQLDPGTVKPACYACTACDMRMCTTCKLWHGTFHKSHSDSVSSLSPDFAPARSVHPPTVSHQTVSLGKEGSGDRSNVSHSGAMPLCRQHGDSPLQLLCLDCDVILCSVCAEPCKDRQHNVVPVDGNQAQDRTQRAFDDIAAASAVLRSLLRADDSSSRGDGESNMSGDEKGADQAIAAAAVQHSLAYADALLASASRACLLHQQSMVFGRLQLLVAAGSSLFEGRQLSAVTCADVTSPSVDPSVDPSCSAFSKGSAVGSDVTGGSQLHDCSRPDTTGPASDSPMCNNSRTADEAGSGDAMWLRIGNPLGHFAAGAGLQCYDVALVDGSDGRRLLIAAQLLYELSESGEQLSSWQPPQLRANGRDPSEDELDDCVSSVDVLFDNRIAVGLYESSCIAVLRLSSRLTGQRSWLEEVRLALPSPPWYLATHGLRLAVSRCDQKRPLSTRCRLVDVIPLDSGQDTLLSFEHEWAVGQLALASSMVVVASAESDTVHANDGTRQWTVDAYSCDQGIRLWRYNSLSAVTDVCFAHRLRQASPVSCVFLAVPASNKIVVLHAEDGHRMPQLEPEQTRADNACIGRQLQPWRLSAAAPPAGREKSFDLATLSADWSTVVVYPLLRQSQGI